MATQKYSPYISPATVCAREGAFLMEENSASAAFSTEENSASGAVANMASNNNCGCLRFNDRLYLGYRTAPFHFAHTDAKMVVVSTSFTDDEAAKEASEYDKAPLINKKWRLELELKLDSDVREPAFAVADGRLTFSCFQAGTNFAKFEPKAIWTTTLVDHEWTAWKATKAADEVPWEIKTRGDYVYKSSYKGDHYSLTGSGSLQLDFEKSKNGLEYEPIDDLVKYVGGVSELGWEFDENNVLFGVGRNEDGEADGDPPFGTVIFRSRGEFGKGEWETFRTFERYDSPRMFRHKSRLFLVARRDLGNGTFNSSRGWLPFAIRKWLYLIAYSLTPKTSSLYELVTTDATPRIVKLVDLPGAGDNAFPSIVSLSEDSFLLCNYTCDPQKASNWSWLRGQLSKTHVYWIKITMRPT